MTDINVSRITTTLFAVAIFLLVMFAAAIISKNVPLLKTTLLLLQGFAVIGAGFGFWVGMTSRTRRR
ncbi:MAG: hypothetical protein P0Y64_03750 [Candidatus Sphingomonas colombiensis]|nr:hypothetical protein [Sphingomonas sp.]WEK43954.1 MAG: hypothetical protein P0Y64_03750 [Sphingomonas sp.]